MWLEHKQRNSQMTPLDFKSLALSLPCVIEKPHFDRVSVRVDAPRGKIITTILEAGATANVFLSPEEQDVLIGAEPAVFSKVPNKWGEAGATTLQLSNIDEATALSALKLSWRRAAPAKLQDLLE